MGTLYLVRHGQASFGAADYDNLSDLGARQCRRLGLHFQARGQRFDAVIRGSLRRHAQSLTALREGLGHGLADGQGQAPAETVFDTLNEYDSAAVVRAVHPAPLPPATSPEAYRHHFRVLRQGLAAWMAGSAQPEGMPRYDAWQAGIAAVLDHVRSQHQGDVLLVSSGGPISTALGLVLGMAPEATIDLNMRIRNSAVCELAFNPKRHTLHTFNHLPHLDGPEFADWVTYT